MKQDNHLKSALAIISDYDGAAPLSFFIKDFFRRHKQMGSRDRKSVSTLVYNYYRLGQAMRQASAEERIFAGSFLCSGPLDFLQHFRPGLEEHSALPVHQKTLLAEEQFPGFRTEDIFPWKQELSEGISHREFCLSFLVQPDLFLRIRLKKPGEVTALLEKSGTGFEMISDNCIALPNGTPVEKIIADRSWYVVQDYSSQRTADYLKCLIPSTPPGSKLPAQGSSRLKAHRPLVWDCCAGSGGKSILLHDLHPGIKLFVTDTRASILQNLHRRFREAGISDYRSAVADLTRPAEFKMTGDRVLREGSLSGIIADVPCSGSGTWSRTPEQLFFFSPGEIDRYARLQQEIVSMTGRFSPKNIPMVYLTCSVFKRENENITGFLEQEGFHTERSGMICGYEKKADSLYAACLVKL